MRDMQTEKGLDDYVKKIEEYKKKVEKYEEDLDRGKTKLRFQLGVKDREIQNLTNMS